MQVWSACGCSVPRMGFYVNSLCLSLSFALWTDDVLSQNRRLDSAAPCADDSASAHLSRCSQSQECLIPGRPRSAL